MATRSTISVLRNDGTVHSAYAHWDGYLSHNGKILVENYTTQEAVEQLIAGGNISVLGERCDGAPGHSYNNPAPGQTVYYGRDRGETDQEQARFPDQAAYQAATGEEYNYLFANGAWYYARGRAATVNDVRLTRELIIAETD
jgi:hypothetical protein